MSDMNWISIYPQVLLLVMACVIAVVDLFIKHPQRTPTYMLTQLSLAVVAGLLLRDFQSGTSTVAFSNMVVNDPLSNLLGFFASVGVMVTLAYSRTYAASREILKGELFSLSMFSLLGMLVMVSGNNVLVTYLGLEMMSLSMYALVALRRDHTVSTEAAMKYFVLGALASGFLLYGMSMLYGATGSLELPKIFAAVAQGQVNKQVLVFALVFLSAGLGFKMGAVPFHMWVPDVYHGAPTAATLLIAGAPKIATFGMVIRLMVGGLFGLAIDWQQMFVVMAVLSLLVGNLAAIAQTNFKRMLAYSTISQMGFVLLGLAGGVTGNTPDGAVGAVGAYSGAMFYVVTYVLTTLGSFGVIMMLSRAGFEADQIADFAGLNKRNAWYAAVVTILMLSLAGIPLTVGFIAKYSVLQTLVLSGSTFNLGLAIFAVVASLIGAFYYLRVIKTIYFDPVQDRAAIEAPADVRILLSLNALAVVALGLFPTTVLTMCQSAISALLVH